MTSPVVARQTLRATCGGSLRRLLPGAAMVLGVLHGGGVAAAEHARTVPLLPLYQQECASCHIAYPPGLLPAASWHRLMESLDRHFGTDAAVDPATKQVVATWLADNAATGKRTREAPPADRITRSSWFLREHDEIGAAVWKLPAVGSPANCGACHTQSERGDFSERNIRIPR